MSQSVLKAGREGEREHEREKGLKLASSKRGHHYVLYRYSKHNETIINNYMLINLKYLNNIK